MAELFAFVSYSTKEKRYAARAKAILAEYGIKSFLAHDDLDVSDEWRKRILRELGHCNVFIPFLSKAFRESDWTAQEIGIIVKRRNVMIIPLSIDHTIPFGFIGHVQGKRVESEEFNEELLITPLTKKRPHAVLPAMIQRVARAGNFRHAEAVMKPLVPLFPVLSDEELTVLVKAAVSNGQVWDAVKCKTEYLPELIELHRKRIDARQLKRLRYQIKHGEWYVEE